MKDSRNPSRTFLIRAMAAFAFLLMVFWGAAYWTRTAADAASEVARAFKKGTVATIFQSYVTELRPTTYLQFAVLKQMEIFERHDQVEILGVSLPEVVVEAKAPVDYTYYLDFKGAWSFAFQDRVVCVRTPPIQFNKPAIDASRIEYREVKSSLWRREGPIMRDLKESLTALSIKRAKQNISIVRESGRKQVEAFIQTWLRKDFGEKGYDSVQVSFPDEPLPAAVMIPMRKKEAF